MLNPHHYALVVGVCWYPRGLETLTGPSNDARAFHTWLTDADQGGLLPENAILLLSPDATQGLDPRKAEPRKDTIDSELRYLVDKAQAQLQALPADRQPDARGQFRLYIFVAGHGIMPGGNQAALLDAKAGPGWQSNLELSSYNNWLALDGTFGEVCIFADCCRTYEPLATPGGPPFDTPSRTRGSVFSLLCWGTAADQLAAEDAADRGRGYFTQALIAGLEGAATHPERGRVTADVLAGYVNIRLSQLTADLPEAERQRLDPAANLSYPMTFGPARPARPQHKIRIHFPAGFTAAVHLQGPAGRLPGNDWDPADGTWVTWLYDGLWQAVAANPVAGEPALADSGAFTVVEGVNDVRL